MEGGNEWRISAAVMVSWRNDAVGVAVASNGEEKTENGKHEIV